MRLLFLFPSILALSLAVSAAAAARPLHEFLEIAVAPDGAHIASVEGDQTPSGEVNIRHLVIRATAGGAERGVALPCGAVPQCTPSDLAWAPDGRTLAFVLRQPGSHDHSIYKVGTEYGWPNLLAKFSGTLGSLHYSPAGQLAGLAIANAGKERGAVEAGAEPAGELGADPHEQRIAILQPDGSLKYASPADLFVYEYDWRPDGTGFVGTAAPGDGDDHWWIAKLYAFDAASAAGRVIFAPPSPQLQIATPKISPDGKQVSFIGGLMSDFGATGGDAFVLPIDGGTATNLTEGSDASITSLGWACHPGGGLVATELADDKIEVATLIGKAHGTKPIYSGTDLLRGGEGTGIARACGTETTAVVRQDFTTAPEIAIGRIGEWRKLTQINAGLTAPVRAQSVHWTQDGFHEQGWLLLPEPAPHPAGASKLPMIVEVHGGPASANVPRFVGGGLARRLLDAGNALFLPNPRGSYGQGEAFTRANVKDFGGGDLRDILAGTTAAEAVAPIDDNRLGISGWSYGGYMTMWAVTQTNRFKAAVAGAGLSDWLSYYGENGIDGWMIPFFGASVYEDPGVYAKSSPINFVKAVKTPTLMVVGAQDIECPAPQTQEFWHALHDLGVPTQAVIYPGEGHWMNDPKHVQDFEDRAVAWFRKYLGGASTPD